MRTLEDKTVFVTGARGIGYDIAMHAGRLGANVVIAAKTVEPDMHSPHTIYSVAEQIEDAGGSALAIQMDIRYEDNVINALDMAVETYGGIDVCINSASAIQQSSLERMPIKSFDLMQQINVRGAMMCVKYAAKYLAQSSQPHIVFITPPTDFKPQAFERHLPYALSKYTTSLTVMALAETYRSRNIAVNGMWHAFANAPIDDEVELAEFVPSTLSEAVVRLIQKDSSTTGQFYVDRTFLQQEGVKDFTQFQKVQSDQDVFVTI